MATKTDNKKPVTIIPNNIVTVPKITPEKIIKQKTLEERLEELYNEIEINLDDLPDELLEIYEELEDGYKEKSIKKNWALWLAMFTPLVLPAFVKGVAGQAELPYDARQSVQVPAPSPKVVTDHAKKYFENHGLELVKTLSQTDCEHLKEQLLANWGKGLKEFKKSFEEDYANTEARLDNIYRTEYVKAQNEGILARAGVAKHTHKIWNSALDERTCPVCGDQLHGTMIPIDENFTAILEHKNGNEQIEIDGPPAHPSCYSEDTEVFTEHGWKLFKDVDPSEQIWTLNLATKLVELDNQINQISYDYSGDMIHFKNRTIDCLVTPDHMMVVQKSWDRRYKDRPYKLIPAIDIAISDVIPRSGKWIGTSPEYIYINDRKFPTKEFMQFMGWYLSEGSISKPIHGSWQIKISQQKEHYRKEIIELCNKIFPKIWISNDSIYIPNMEDIKDYFICLGHSHEKYIPSELLQFSPELLKELLVTFVKGDGSINKNKWIDHPEWNFQDQMVATSSSPLLINGLTEIALKIGLRPNFRTKLPIPVKHHNGIFTAKYPQICIDFGNYNNTHYKKSFSHVEQYSGKVYCLEMSKNHSLYVRRNGKVNWSGNCRCVLTTLSQEDADEMKENSVYLDEVSNFIKLNYKCPKGTIDETNDGVGLIITKNSTLSYNINEMKENSVYLDDVINFIKLNYNCPNDEKIGSGPGSCGGGQLSSEKAEQSNLSSTKISEDAVEKSWDADTYKFSDTGGKVTPAMFHKTISGKNIVISKNTKNITIDGILDVIKDLPEELSKNIKNIEVTNDICDRNTAAIGTYYRDSKTITFYNKISTLSKLKNTLYHELGHALDNRRGGNIYMSSSQEYKQAVKNDGKKFVSRYAASKGDAYQKYREDFADSVREYIKNEKKFSKNYPNRANYIRKKINELKQNVAYLDDISNFIKLNYKCEKETIEDSNKCNTNDSSVFNDNDFTGSYEFDGMHEDKLLYKNKLSFSFYPDLQFIKLDKINLNYKCKTGELEAGTNKCGLTKKQISDENIDHASDISLINDIRSSLFDEKIVLQKDTKEDKLFKDNYSDKWNSFSKKQIGILEEWQTPTSYDIKTYLNESKEIQESYPKLYINRVGSFSYDDIIENLDNIITNSETPEDIDTYRNFDPSKMVDIKEGDTISSKCYMSVGMQKDIALLYNAHYTKKVPIEKRQYGIIKISVPKGTNAMYIPAGKRLAHSELVLNRNMPIVIDKVQKYDKITYINAHIDTTMLQDK